MIIHVLTELHFPGHGLHLVPGEEREIPEPVSQNLRDTLERHAWAGNLRIDRTAKPAPVPASVSTPASTVQVSVGGVVEQAVTDETVAVAPPKTKRGKRTEKP